MFCSKKIAFVSDNEKDRSIFKEIYEKEGWNIDLFFSNGWEKLIKKVFKYKYILIDMKLGNGLLSVEIAQRVWKEGYTGRTFLLAGGSMEIFYHRFATVIMKDSLKKKPDIIFNEVETTQMDMMAETVFMKRAICKKG